MRMPAHSWARGGGVEKPNMIAPSFVRRLSEPAPAQTELAPRLHMDGNAAVALEADMAEATSHITSVEAPATRRTTPLSAALMEPVMSALHNQVALTEPQAIEMGKRMQSMPPVTLESHLEASE